MIGLYPIPPEGVPYISVQDSALNIEKADPAHYFETLDRKYQATIEGKTPTVFWLRRLTLKQYEGVRGMPQAQQDRAAVAYCVEKVDNFRCANGEMLRCVHVGEGEERRLDMDTLKSFHTAALFAELATAILKLSGLDPLAGAR